MAVAHDHRPNIRLNPQMRAALTDFVEQAEKREQRVRALRDATKDDIAALKSKGFNPAALRSVLAERRKAANERPAVREARDLYRDALSGRGGR